MALVGEGGPVSGDQPNWDYASNACLGTRQLSPEDLQTIIKATVEQVSNGEKIPPGSYVTMGGIAVRGSALPERSQGWRG